MKKIRCNYKHEIKGKHVNNRVANTIKEVLDIAKARNITSEALLAGMFSWKLSRKGGEYWAKIFNILLDKYNPIDIQ